MMFHFSFSIILFFGVERVRVLRITTTNTMTTVRCSASPPQDFHSHGLVLLVRWRVGPVEIFILNKDLSLRYREDSNVIARGNGTRNMTYINFKKYRIGFTEESLAEDDLLFRFEMTFQYTFEQENSLFLCFTGCTEPLVFKSVRLTTPNGQCNVNRYNLEFPCKYSGYIDVEDGPICVKLVDEPVPWDEARARCEHTYRGSLLKIPDRFIDDKVFRKLLATAKVRKVWIGLQNRRLSENGSQEFGWLQETEPATYYNWELSHRNEASTTHGCVVKNVQGGKWSVAHCFRDAFPYVCQEVSARDPGKPSLKVSYTSGLKSASLGDELVANCSSFTTVGAVTIFRFLKVSDRIDITRNNSPLGASLVWEENGHFVTVDDRCFPRSTVVLRLRLTTKLSRVTGLACCWKSRDHSYSRCSNTVVISLLYPPQPPVLTIIGRSKSLSVHGYLVASCSVCVGSGGQQTWTLITLTRSLTWKSNFPEPAKFVSQPKSVPVEESSFTSEEGDTAITWKANMATKCGPHIRSTFKRRVTRDLHGSVLLCGSINRNSYQFFQTSNTTARSQVYEVLGEELEIGLSVDYGPLTSVLAILLIILIPFTICMTWGTPFSRLTKRRRNRGGSRGWCRKKRKKRKRSVVTDSSDDTRTTETQSTKSEEDDDDDSDDEEEKEDDGQSDGKESSVSRKTTGGPKSLISGLWEFLYSGDYIEPNRELCT